jgi:hypothetical protein
MLASTDDTMLMLTGLSTVHCSIGFFPSLLICSYIVQVPLLPSLFLFQFSFFPTFLKVNSIDTVFVFRRLLFVLFVVDRLLIYIISKHFMNSTPCFYLVLISNPM